MHPEREIKVWLHLRDCYLHFTNRRHLNLDQKRDILMVIVTTSFQDSDPRGETVNCLTPVPQASAGDCGVRNRHLETGRVIRTP